MTATKVIDTPWGDEVWAVRDFKDSRPQVLTHAGTVISKEASFALRLVERWGTMQIETAGEDTSGRAKAVLMDEKDIANRACDIAEETFAAIRQRGWEVAIPGIDEMQDALAAAGKDSK
jgi:hypothetical protein